jgi:hypothetical protein
MIMPHQTTGNAGGASVRRHKHHPHHLGSIALNNMAVTLLEREDYVDALETMKDSINLMKWFCRPIIDLIEDEAVVDENLTKAMHRCVKGTPAATKSSLLLPARAHFCGLLGDWKVVVFGTYVLTPCVQLDTAQNDRLRRAIFPIRIDDCLCGFGDPDFEAAVRTIVGASPPTQYSYSPFAALVAVYQHQ